MESAARGPRRRQRKGGVPVELRRLTRGEAIAAVSAVLLLALTFVDWFRGQLPGGQSVSAPHIGGSAWESMDWIPILLLAAIVAALAAAILKLSGSRYRPAVPVTAVVAILGGASVLAIVWRLIDTPSVEIGGLTIETSVQLGAFLALAAAVGVAYGGYTAMREEGVSFGSVAERLKE